MKKEIEEFKNEMQQSVNEFASEMRKAVDDFTSTFEEPKKEVKQAVECGNEDELAFVCGRVRIEDYMSYASYATNNPCVSLDGRFIFTKISLKADDYQIFQFQDYLTQENLQDKYNDLLLEKAKREYPEGMKHSGSSGTGLFVVTDVHINKHGLIMGGGSGCLLDREGKWAEKLTPLFKTEDGIDIYEGDACVPVRKGNLDILSDAYCDSMYSEYWYFSTTKEAEKWVKEERERKGERLYSVRKSDLMTGGKRYIKKRLDDKYWYFKNEAKVRGFVDTVRRYTEIPEL